MSDGYITDEELETKLLLRKAKTTKELLLVLNHVKRHGGSSINKNELLTYKKNTPKKIWTQKALKLYNTLIKKNKQENKKRKKSRRKKSKNKFHSPVPPMDRRGPMSKSPHKGPKKCHRCFTKGEKCKFCKKSKKKFNFGGYAGKLSLLRHLEKRRKSIERQKKIKKTQKAIKIQRKNGKCRELVLNPYISNEEKTLIYEFLFTALDKKKKFFKC